MNKAWSGNLEFAAVHCRGELNNKMHCRTKAVVECILQPQGSNLTRVIKRIEKTVQALAY